MVKFVFIFLCIVSLKEIDLRTFDTIIVVGIFQALCRDLVGNSSEHPVFAPGMHVVDFPTVIFFAFLFGACYPAEKSVYL